MAQQPEYDEVTANEAHGFSGFGGHLLAAQQETMTESANSDNNGNGNGYIETLASLGIEDVEQLLAVAAIEEVRPEVEAVLHLQNANLQTLLDQLKAPLSPERVAQLSSPAPLEFGLGVLVPSPEVLAAAEASANLSEAATAVGLPTAINLIPYMSPIRNQGSRGTCVAFAVTAINEYILRRRGLVRDLSEQHIYYETKLIDGSPTGCGTWQAKAMLALQSRGQCQEVIWPYNAAPPCNNHGPLPPRARPDGLNYRLNLLAVPARDVASYKLHFSKQRPVGLSIPVYNSWYQSAESRRSGRITMRIGNEPAVGGHAVCLVGYQDTPSSPGGGYFIVRNSWSTTWASASPYGAGYGIIPYQYITNDAWEAFTAVVPGIMTDDEQPQPDENAAKSTVTINVGPNVKITIDANA